MKILSLLLIFVGVSCCCGQSVEFETNKDDLIYSDKAIEKLKHIVDSLNLKFKTCDNRVYYTNMQGKGTYFSIQGANVLKAKKAIQSGMSPQKLKKQFTESLIEPDLLVVKHLYKDYVGKEVVVLVNVGLNNTEFELSFRKEEHANMSDKNKGWVFIYHEKSEYSDESLEAFYLEGLKSVKLKDNYSRLVQYSDCLIDTTATVYFKNADKTGVRYSYKEGKVDEMLKYIDEKLNKPVFEYNELNPKVADSSTITMTPVLDTTITDTTEYVVDDLDYKKYQEFLVTLTEWEKTHFEKVDQLMKNDQKFQKLFADAYTYAKEGKEITNDEFEEYVERYISKNEALYFKRNRRVIGGCSMDNSPRIHAMNIAELAAETAEWEVFLRSHLDIMNDRFDRVSDGSYAYAGRKTYIKELEVLDINVNDLLLGICLRVENPSENHYFGSIGRIGRSLSEARNKEDIEGVMLEMITDKDLDDYNRVLIYWLFQNYNHNLEDESLIASNNKKIKSAIASMPDYLSKKYELKE